MLFYWRVLVSVTAHVPYDIEAYHYPLLAYMAKCVRHGWFPLWDPYTYAGMPLHADLQAQMFYPPAWLAIFLGNLSEGRQLFYWVEWLLPFHMALGGLFAYLLLRRMNVVRPASLMGASVYQLGGFFASQACHLGAICCGAWLPLAVLATFESRHGFRRRWFVILTAAISMSILSGYAATTIVVAGAVILMAATLRTWRLLPVVAGAFALAALVTAVQLIPLMQLTGLSIASLRSEWLTAWGVPLQGLVSLIWPNYYGIFDLSKYRLHLNFTLLYIYCGVIPLLLLLAAPFLRRARVYLALTLVCAVWMLGEHTPVYGLVFGHLPSLVRGASYAWYALMAFCLFAGVTAAIVLDTLGGRMHRYALWGLALFTSADLIYSGANRPMNSAEGGYRQTSSEYRYRGSAEDLKKLHDLVDISIPPARIDYADLWSPGIAMAGMLDLPTTDGNIPFMLRRMFELRALYCATAPNARDLAIAGSESPIFRRNLPVNRFDSPLLRMTNTAVIGSADNLPGQTESIGGLNLLRVPDSLPRFYLARAVRSSAGETETFRLLSDPSFDPAKMAIAEGVAADLVGLNGGQVKVREYTPNRIALHVESAGSGYLVTSEAWYPGWHAVLNGDEKKLLITNGVFRGLEVPSGTSEIVMAYHPGNLVWSGMISLFAVAIATALGLARSRSFTTRSGKRSDPPFPAR